MGIGSCERLRFNGPAVWSALWSVVLHETVGVVLMHAHVIFEVDVVGELRGVVGLTIEVDLSDIMTVVGVSWVIADVPFWDLRLNGWGGVTDHDQGFLRCRITELFLQSQGSGRVLKVILQSRGYHEGLGAQRVN